MPRLPRVIIPGQPHHIIQRGNNRSPIFAADEDYECMKHYLFDATKCHECQIHAWVFMTNHVHLLLTPKTEKSLPKAMQSVGRRYVQYFNHTYRRTGTLWEGRFKSTLVDSENYLFTCYRYIELNPVRANMTTHPGEYTWSSYHANALGRDDKLIDPHPMYIALGDTGASRQESYRKLFHTHIDEKEIEKVRESTQKGWVLGSNQFIDEIEALTKRRTQPLMRGGDRRSMNYRKKVI